MVMNNAQKAKAQRERDAADEAARLANEPVQKVLGDTHSAIAGHELGGDELDGDTVTMLFPVKVTLTLDNHNSITFGPGVNEVPEELQDHWYLKSHGVQKYEKRKPKVEEAE